MRFTFIMWWLILINFLTVSRVIYAKIFQVKLTALKFLTAKLNVIFFLRSLDVVQLLILEMYHIFIGMFLITSTILKNIRVYSPNVNKNLNAIC